MIHEIKMPKYYKKKRKSYGRRRGSSYTTMGSAKFLAKKALAGLRFLKGLVNVEAKRFDAGTGGSQPDYNGLIYPLAQIAAGDDANQRSGNSILGKTLLLRLDCATSISTGSSIILRMIILKDMFNTGTTPTVADVLQATGSVIATTSPLNLDTTSRYQILRDKCFVLESPGNGGKSAVNLKYFITYNDHIKFTGTAGTDEYKNQPYLILITNNATGNICNVNWSSRVMYYDN